MIPWRAIAVVGVLALGAGCATDTTRGLAARPASAGLVGYAAEILIGSVAYTRASGREVAGWCWSDKATGRLASVTRDRVGEGDGVGVAVPSGRGRSTAVSCSWHTHPWGPQVAPGPSEQDLRNSLLPWVSGMVHFVLDQHGIWQYSNGRVIEMCPWDRDGTGLDKAGCRSGPHGPTNTNTRVVRFYGRRD
jgi:hypothetical protein